VAADPAATEFESRVDAGTTFALAGTAGAHRRRRRDLADPNPPLRRGRRRNGSVFLSVNVELDRERTKRRSMVSSDLARNYVARRRQRRDELGVQVQRMQARVLPTVNLRRSRTPEVNSRRETMSCG